MIHSEDYEREWMKDNIYLAELQHDMELQFWREYLETEGKIKIYDNKEDQNSVRESDNRGQAVRSGATQNAESSDSQRDRHGY